MLKQKIQNKIIANSPYQLVTQKRPEKNPFGQNPEIKSKESKKTEAESGLLFEPENLKPFMTCPDVLSEDLDEDANALYMNMSDHNTTINEYVNILGGENQKNFDIPINWATDMQNNYESNTGTNDTKKTLSIESGDSLNGQADNLMRSSPSEIKLESSEILTYQDIGISPRNLGNDSKYKYVDMAKASFQNRFNQSLQKKSSNNTAAFSSTGTSMKLAASPNTSNFKKNQANGSKGLKSSVISKSISGSNTFYSLKNNYKNLKSEGKENANPLRSSLGEFEIPKDSQRMRKESVPSNYNSISHRSSTNQSQKQVTFSPSKTVEAIITPRALLRNSEIINVRNSDTLKSIDLKQAREALRSPSNTTSSNGISQTSGSGKHKKNGSGKFPTSTQINLIDKMDAEYAQIETGQNRVEKYIEELDGVYLKLKDAIRSKHEDVFKNNTLVQYLENLKALANGTYSLIRDLKSDQTNSQNY